MRLDFWLNSENTSNLTHEDCGIETAVEDRAWSFLKTRCELLLKLYPTTKEVRCRTEQIEQLDYTLPLMDGSPFQEDERLLAEDLGQRRRMCVLLRVAEKRILLSTIDYASHKIRK